MVVVLEILALVFGFTLYFGVGAYLANRIVDVTWGGDAEDIAAGGWMLFWPLLLVLYPFYRIVRWAAERGLAHRAGDE